MTVEPALRDIPFHQPYCSPRAQQNLQAVLSSGRLSGNGPFAQQCRGWLEEHHPGSRAFLTPSCTSALEMAGVLLQLRPGDEVVVPAYTFVSSASAFALLGARPVFVDVQPDTLNLDPDQLEAALSPRTRAVVAVHYAGVACKLESLLEITRQAGVELIEDAAHGLLGSYRGRPLGTFGSLATFSFHETKNLSCGEGGALLVNRPDWVEKAEIVQEKGTDRSKFLLGLSDKYTWVDHGSSYLMSELNAALLWSNLEDASHLQQRRQHIWSSYHRELKPWCSARSILQPGLPEGSQHPAHIYYLRTPNLELRQSLMQYLRSRGVLAAYHYQALSASPMALKLNPEQPRCPVAEDIARTLIRLPIHSEMSQAELERVLETVTGWSPP